MGRTDVLRKLLALGELCRQEIDATMGGDLASVAYALSTLRARGELVYIRDGRMQTYFRLTEEARAKAFQGAS